MEEYTWKNLFENEILDQGINHVWSFSVDVHLKTQQGYLQYTQCTFARFQCSQCLRSWNSAQVHILFLIRWDRIYRRGTVKMRIFKQKCRRCNVSILEKPEITNENIKRVISNLVSKIQCMVYSKNTMSQPLKPVIYSDDVEGPHEKEHCEACKMHVCTWNTVHQGKTVVAKPLSTNLPRWTGSGSFLEEQHERNIFLSRNNYTSYGQTIPARQEDKNVALVIILLLFVVGFFFIITGKQLGNV